MCTDTFRATHPLPEDDVGGVKLTEDVDDQFDREVLDTASWEETDSSPCVDYFYDSLVSVGTAHGCTARADGPTEPRAMVVGKRRASQNIPD